MHGKHSLQTGISQAVNTNLYPNLHTSIAKHDEILFPKRLRSPEGACRIVCLEHDNITADQIPLQLTSLATYRIVTYMSTPWPMVSD